MPRQSGLADREPCPWRIVDDVGGAYCMGCVGGTLWHTVKGARLAPAGYMSRWNGSVTAVVARAPVLGGQFAIWGGLFACCDCSLTAIRQKEDPWNSIASGAITGGILAARAGPRQMASAALVGGVLLALIEGMGIMFTRMMSQPAPTADDYAAAAAAAQRDVTAPPTAGGLFPSSFPSFGGPSAPSSSPPPLPEPAMHDTFMESDGVTTFSTEATRKDDLSETSSSSSGWWPFGK